MSDFSGYIPTYVFFIGEFFRGVSVAKCTLKTSKFAVKAKHLF